MAAVRDLGGAMEIYATGLGVRPEGVAVTIGGQAATVLYAGLAPGFVGLNQVNVTTPAGLAAGEYDLVLRAGGVSGPPVRVNVAKVSPPACRLPPETVNDAPAVLKPGTSSALAPGLRAIVSEAPS